ncbi:RNA polymerase sigma factor [Pendulispora albinea]|uniref:RNA polymerase sigma factor n=1 Tax=Pendulispora albinea TaxID=2741071 RepID=A0ABZ2MCT0_9BACT
MNTKFGLYNTVHNSRGSPQVTYARATSAVGDSASRPPYKSVFSVDFNNVFETYESYVTRVLRRLGVSSSDCNDVCQDVFVVVHRKLRDFDGRAPMRSWIYGICARTASTYRRSARVRFEEVREECPELNIAASQDKRIEVLQTLDCIEATLRRLDNSKREVFVLHDLEGLPMSEVAHSIGCPLQTAYSRLHAVRKTMKDAILRDCS